MTSKAQIIVEVGSDGQAHAAFEGNEMLIMPLVGIMEHVKADMLSHVRSKYGFGLNFQTKPTQSGTVLPSKKHNTYPAERKTTRDQAIEATMYAIEALNMRVQAMRDSPPDQTFTVDDDLLSRL